MTVMDKLESTDQWQVCQEQTWKKLILVRKPIFRVEKCPQIQRIPKHIKVPKQEFFPHYIRCFLTEMD